jgi:hypothetical protein
MSEARNELVSYSYNAALTLYQLTSKTEYNIYILYLVALHITSLTYDTTQKVRVLLQSLAVEHMQFTLNAQILKLLSTNFSLYSSILADQDGPQGTNGKVGHLFKATKSTAEFSCTRLQIFFVWGGTRNKTNTALFTF